MTVKELRHLANTGGIILLLYALAIAACIPGCANCQDPENLEFSSIERAVDQFKQCKFDYYVAISKKLEPSIYSTNIPSWLETLDNLQSLDIYLNNGRQGKTNKWKKDNYRVFSEYFTIDLHEGPRDMGGVILISEKGEPIFEDGDDYIVARAGIFVPNEVNNSGSLIMIRGHIGEGEVNLSKFELDRNNLRMEIVLKEEYREGGVRVYVVDQIRSVLTWTTAGWELKKYSTAFDDPDAPLELKR